MNKYKNRIEPFAVGYLNADRDDVGYRIACGMRERMKHMPIYIRDDQVFAGFYEINEEIGYYFNSAHIYLLNSARKLLWIAS